MSKTKLILSIFIFASILGFISIYPNIQLSQTPYQAPPPEPQRDDSVKKFLIPSIRILNNYIAGSGTICYYDSKNNIAYVLSCAHLFYVENNNIIIEVFYHNNKKLITPKQYSGEIIALKIDDYKNDIAIIKFKPDWEPIYFPISKLGYRYKHNTILNSVGCDAATEVANYYVKIYELESNFLVTYENSPRPGRSGGGLITNDRFIVGICARTDAVDGSGKGYYVHINTIHQFCKNNKLEFLINNNSDQILPYRSLYSFLIHCFH
jgi:hypothetical protein